MDQQEKNNNFSNITRILFYFLSDFLGTILYQNIIFPHMQNFKNKVEKQRNLSHNVISLQCVL